MSTFHINTALQLRWHNKFGFPLSEYEIPIYTQTFNALQMEASATTTKAIGKDNATLATLPAYNKINNMPFLTKCSASILRFGTLKLLDNHM